MCYLCPFFSVSLWWIRFLSPLCWALDYVVASWWDFLAVRFDPCHEAGRMQFGGRTSRADSDFVVPTLWLIRT